MRIRINGRGHLGPQVANELHRLKNGGRPVDVELAYQNKSYKDFPDVIIHTSWQTNVDRCTTHPRESYHVSMAGLREAIEMHRKYGSHLIFVSSSYVFNGKKVGPYDTDDQPDPISAYGKMKFMGEKEVLGTAPLITEWHQNCHAAVIRTDALYDGRKSYSYSKGATDQISNPTYIPFLARVLAEYAVVLGKNAYSEEVFARPIYHVTGPEIMSRYEFIKNFANPRVEPVPMELFDLPAKRPLNSSVVNSDDFIKALGVKHVTIEDVKSRGVAISY